MQLHIAAQSYKKNKTDSYFSAKLNPYSANTFVKIVVQGIDRH
jgi:hypothetical protein